MSTRAFASPTPLRRGVVTILALALASSALGCDPGEPDELDEEALDEEALDEETPEGQPPAPPRIPIEASRPGAPALDLHAPSDPAASGWLAAVSEETPPATCDSSDALIGADCMGAYCDYVQGFCLPHGGSPGEHSWSPWFSEENDGSFVCPGTQWVTGIACRGAWCDDVSIECTELGLTASGCAWSGWFGAGDPVFFASPGEIIGGIKCKGAYCDELSYLHCSV